MFSVAQELPTTIKHPKEYLKSLKWRAFLNCIVTLGRYRYSKLESLLVANSTFCMITKIIIIWWFKCSLFFLLILKWSLFSHCLMFFVFLYIYIYNFTSCHVQFMVCTPWSECHCEWERTLNMNRRHLAASRREESGREGGCFCVFLFRSFFFFFLYCNECSEPTWIWCWHVRRIRGAFLVWCFFFPLPLSFFYLYFHDLSRGSLIILLMKICSGQNIFVVIKQWTS